MIRLTCKRIIFRIIMKFCTYTFSRNTIGIFCNTIHFIVDYVAFESLGTVMTYDSAKRIIVKAMANIIYLINLFGDAHIIVFPLNNFGTVVFFGYGSSYIIINIFHNRTVTIGQRKQLSFFRSKLFFRKQTISYFNRRSTRFIILFKREGSTVMSNG